MSCRRLDGDATLRAYGDPFFLPRLAALWDFQSGYRYHAMTGEILQDWEHDWLVIADQGGDPFILSRRTGRILFAVHGVGVWQPAPMFESLEQMLLCLGALSAVCTAGGADFADAGSSIRPLYLDELVNRLAECDLAPDRARQLLRDLGWT
jgi:hypothetical protein